MPFSTTPAALGTALAARGYATATPVQAGVLVPEAQERDLLVSAQTGSGKTVAYGLAMAPTLLGDAERLPRAAEPLALVIAPTRELALQVARELDWLYKDAGAIVVTCVGGMEIRREARALQQGSHIVVGTPGRLRDHLERGTMATGSLKVVVLDEADEMLDLGFREDLEEILDSTPAERRTLLFSATLPKPIQTLAKRYQKNAFRIATANDREQHSDIDYRAIRVAPNDLEVAVVNTLRYFEAGAALVFASTREGVRRLHANLVERGFAAVALSGELSQADRTHALQALRDRRARVCVATDVAARGIDLPDLGLVIHAELPHDAEVLQHRSGRTGRAGKKGVCVVLVPYPKRHRAESLLRAANVRAEWMDAPTAEAIYAKDQERMLDEVADAGDEREAAEALMAAKPAVDIAAALLRLQRARLPAPEDLSDTGPAARAVPDGPRPGFEDTVWFRINAGRNNNADPRWLLPYLCRRGHLTKREIGAIRIFDRETRFEIPRAAATRFVQSLKKTDDGDPDVAIEPVGDAPEPNRTPRRGPPAGGGGQRGYARR
ncbi:MULTISPECIES: DEAD/DEAH box helicase [Sphingosinicellaceae]|uniref:DEAD/DEAH box helicase n=1 Tax=Sphingosinicellaceae TaxID=2820280 RepID=UPI001C1E8D45|nr:MULTISPECIES: DEAD/DEAH box helicase [Polymorphobacter]QYE34086.1 DEAD/DEAH box helicase [Polymorphobacter sp. PAMC 29334]UAJ09264.1 DEAD/DEAH box helicase [Polymorphobacter megasporae]